MHGVPPPPPLLQPPPQQLQQLTQQPHQQLQPPQQWGQDSAPSSGAPSTGQPAGLATQIDGVSAQLRSIEDRLSVIEAMLRDLLSRSEQAQ